MHDDTRIHSNPPLEHAGLDLDLAQAGVGHGDGWLK
jgi:hypothetical protein